MTVRLNKYRHIQVDGGYIVTTDHGSNLFLEELELEQLKKELFSDKLFDKLYSAGILIDEGNIDNVVKKYKKRMSTVSQGTSLHIMVLTERCNMKCVYCHASAEDESCEINDMNKEVAKKTVDFIFQSPSKYIMIEFQGGEPTLNFDVIKFTYEYAISKNKYVGKDLLFSVVTNFAKVDDEVLDWFVENNIGVCTSFDGPEILHNSNRKIVKGNNSYERVTLGVKNLLKKQKEKGNSKTVPNALITVTKKSLNYHREIVDEYISLGLSSIHLRFLNELGYAKQSWGVIGYSPEEFIDFWKKSIDYMVELNSKGVAIRERQTEIILKKILTDFDPNFLELKSPCGAAIGQMAYTPNGDIYTCDEARMIESDLFKLGNVFQDNYKDVILSNKCANIVSSSVNDGLICEFCAFKPYCGVCPVCNFAEQGTVKPNILRTSRCRIYKAQFSYVFSKLQDPVYEKVFRSWIRGK